MISRVLRIDERIERLYLVLDWRSREIDFLSGRNTVVKNMIECNIIVTQFIRLMVVIEK